MIHAHIRRVAAILDASRAYSTIERLVDWHRLPTSMAYHSAVDWAAEELASSGLATTKFAHPTDGNRAYFGYVTPPRWECRSGWLEVEIAGSVRRFADFDLEPLSVIQRSASTAGVVETEVVVVEGGSRAADYPDDIAGKILLSSGPIEDLLELGIRRRGAAGLIVDSMAVDPNVRPAGSLPDAIQWALFPYYAGRTLEGWGFALSPQDGSELRQGVRSGRVCARASIDVEIGEGLLEGVEAVLHGETTEEIWLVAHLCHPAPFANDNASGAALLIEVARVLATLARERPFRRTIRFLFPVEIAGTLAWLSQHPHRVAIAGLNLDMVGERQEVTGSTLCIDRPPDSCPSCLPELLQEIYASAAPSSSGLSGNESYPYHRLRTTRFSGGSDHWVFSDPSITVPTPMLIEWPDRFYHTTADRLEAVDPATLRLNGVSAATYALFLATADPAAANWLRGKAIGRSLEELAAIYRSEPVEGVTPHPGRRLRYCAERFKENLRWLTTVGASPRDDAGAELIIENLAASLGALPPESWTPDAVPRCGARIPRGAFPGVISHFAYVGRLSPQEWDRYREYGRQHEWAAKTYFKHITHWMDGRRTVNEIADLLFLSLGRLDVEYLAYYVELLEQLGLVELSPAV